MCPAFMCYSTLRNPLESKRLSLDRLEFDNEESRFLHYWLNFSFSTASVHVSWTSQGSRCSSKHGRYVERMEKGNDT